MDRRLNLSALSGRDRRAVNGRRLAKVLGGGHARTFDELLAASGPLTVGELARWVAHGIEGGLLEELPPDGEGSRRFRLRRSEAELLQSRRRDDPRS